MSSLQYLDITYSKWKQTRDFFGGTVNSYYVVSPEGYIVVLVNVVKNLVITSRLHHGNADKEANILDFETTIKDLAIQENSVDDCVVAAIIGA